MAPANALWRLADSAMGGKSKHEPTISVRTAALLSMFFTLLYVLPFYLSSRTRPSTTLNRDAPSVIRARIRVVTTAVTISCLATFYLLHDKAHFTVENSLHHLGIWPVPPAAIIQPLLLTMILFLGPLYDNIYLQRSLSPLSKLWSEIVTSLSSSIGYRNYIAGPVTEELLFRCTILPLHLLSPLAQSPAKLVFLTPLYFGIAHVHHFYEFRLTHPDTPLTPALLRTIFQFTYTTIFGWYAAFIYLRTGSLFAVCIVHAFCNYMGFPRLWGRVEVRPWVSKSYQSTQLGPVIRGKDDAEKEPLSYDAQDREARGKFVFAGINAQSAHTSIYYILLLVGVYGFTKSLWLLTDSKNQALVTFGK